MNWTQQLVNGLILGHAYALVAIGWTVLLGVARLVNFGHGQMYMIGAFAGWFLLSRLGLPYPVAILGSMLVGACLGLLMQQMMMKLTITQNLVSVMIVTLGFGHVFHGVAALVFGSTGQIYDTVLSTSDIFIGDLWLTGQDIAIVVVCILLFALVRYVVEYTRVGRTTRMVAEDPLLARLSGIDVNKVYLGVFAFEGAAVALAACLVAPRTPILTSMGFEEVILTFVVVVLGGVGSVLGSYLAGLGLGLFAAFFGALVSPAYSTAAAFLVLTVVLVVRPGGLAASTARGH